MKLNELLYDTALIIKYGPVNSVAFSAASALKYIRSA